ncbi:MAG: hypothetical protein JEY91_15700 [Spirochaetaceae bacterium]|nr:hypothetical protein [Spirochaetaceae bacterium]
MKIILKLSSLSIIIIVLLSGCNLFTDPVSPADRLSLFETDLNSDSRDTIYENFHSSAAMYNQIKTSTWWNNQFSTDNKPFSFNVSMSAAVGGIITGTGTLTYNSLDFDITMTFKEEDEDVWYIFTLTLVNPLDVNDPLIIN